MIASNVDAMTDGSDEADEERDQEPAADGDDVLADGDRPVASTVDGGQTLTSLGAPECAEHSADDSAAERAEGKEDLGHENLPTGANDIRTLTRTGWMIRPNQKRQNRMSEARIALAPIDA